MSPSRRERVLVGFSPERVSALSLTGMFRPRLIDRHAVPLVGQRHDQWDKGMAALDSLFADPAWRDHDITVILSSHYVRHAVIPATHDLAEVERIALAKVVFHDIFGDLANDWTLRVSPVSGGKPTLSSGVPRGLLEGLQTLCSQAGRLYSVQPGLMPVFNCVRRGIGRSAACLALVEPGRVTLASVENGQWQYVDSRAGDGSILPQLLLEEGELHQRKPGGILWLCDMTEAARLPEDSFWSSRRIRPPQLAGFDEISSLAVWGMA